MNNIAKFFRETNTGRFFIPLGIILIVFGIIMIVIKNDTKNYIKTESIVSKIELAEEAHDDGETHYDATYHVYVKYTVDGKEYETELGELSGYKEGDKVTIIYDPSDPSKISQQVNIMLPICIIIAGVGSIIGGIISLVKALKNHKKMQLQEEEWNNGN